MSHTAVANIVAWVLATIGCGCFIVAGIGVAFFLIAPDQRGNSEIAASLHDTYYIIHRGRGNIWPLLLCMILSAAIGIIGYTLTTRHIVRTLQQHQNSKT